MSGISQAIQPAINSSKKYGQAAVASANTGEANAQSAYQEGVNVSENALNPFISGGTTAYNQYLNALGLSSTSANPNYQAPQQGYYNSSNQFSALPSNNAGSFLGSSATPGMEYYDPNIAQAKANSVAAGNDLAEYQSFKSLSNLSPAQQAQASANPQNKFITSQGQLNQDLSALGYNQVVMGGGNGSPTITTPGATGSQILSQLQATPGYQNMLQQGLQGINQASAAQGLLGSGAQGQALMQYGQNYAENYYQNYLNQLSNAANTGETAGGQLASAVTSGSNAQQGAATTAGGQAAAANTATQKQVGTLQAGNLTVPGLNTSLLGIGTNNL